MNKTFTFKKSLHHLNRNLNKTNHEKNISNNNQDDTLLFEEYFKILDAIKQPENDLTGPNDEVISRIISYSKALADIDIKEPGFRLMIQN